jgi:two-component system, OmpR family, response regulator
MPNTQSLRIVIVEDNAQMAEMINDYLQQKFPHAKITKFNTGERALEETKSPPDLFILDYNLDSQESKALNGIQILMKLKQKFDAPVVFLSGQERTDVSASIIKYGAYDYVVKNQESFHRLEIIVNNILSGREMKRELDSHKRSTRVMVVVVVAIIVALVLFKMIG